MLKLISAFCCGADWICSGDILTFSLGSQVTTTTPRTEEEAEAEAEADEELAEAVDDEDDDLGTGISEAGGILGRLPETGRHTQVNIFDALFGFRFRFSVSLFSVLIYL